ncbi:hypothetical protein D9M72_635630 [compost metagenome]
MLIQQRADHVQVLGEDHLAMLGALGGMAARGGGGSRTRLDDFMAPRSDFDPVRMVLVLRLALERGVAEFDVDVLH